MPTNRRTVIDLCEEMPTEDIERPPAGSSCIVCKGNGHFCPAKVYREDEMLCLECRDGVPCSRQQLTQTRRTVVILGETVELEERVAKSPRREIIVPRSSTSIIAKPIETPQQCALALSPRSATSIAKLPDPSHPYGLTDRELEVVRCILESYANKEIASFLGISIETVKRHLSNIFNKTGQGTRLELAMFVVAHQLVRLKKVRATPTKNRVAFTCNNPTCEKLFYDYASRPHKFCSRECRAAIAAVTRKCGWCHIIFNSRRSEERKFCSSKCAKAHQRRRFPAEEIEQLYIEERWSSVRIGRKFGVDACSILAVLHRAGVEIRKSKDSGNHYCIEPGCKDLAQKVRHAGNGAMYGSRCKEHRRIHYNELNKWRTRRVRDISPERWLNQTDRAWASLDIQTKERLLEIALSDKSPTAR